jgi:hypothetical protein
MSKALVLIEVDGGLVSDVHRSGEVSYHIVDWDVSDVGEEMAELPAEFAAVWPEYAEAVRQKNAELETGN